MKPWAKYSIIRVVLFAAALTLFLLLGVIPWIAAVAAALIGLAIAYIFFRPQRDELVRSITKESVPTTDETAEDEL